MARLYHVTSARNRASIDEHGLDWTRMGDAGGIAGASTAEVAGVFMCRDLGEVQFFAGFRDDVDVWAVDGLDEKDLVESPEGFVYLPRPVPRKALTRVDAPPSPNVHHGPGSAYGSSLTITLDDGTVLRDDEARDRT